MTRVKKGQHAIKNRRTILKMTKGYRHGRKSKEAAANQAIQKAGHHAFNDRRKKKVVFRQLWITRLNAALRTHGETYSKFFDKVTKRNIAVNRKMLSEIANFNPETFKKFIAEVNK